MPKLLQLIVACAENRVIGRGGKLPWVIPEDLKFFEDCTAGQICVMGRVCYDTWPGAAQHGRRAIVLARHPLRPRRARRDAGEQHPPVVVSSLAAALDIAETLPGELYICGGERIYAESLALARPMRLHLTLIHAEVAGDTFFPEWRQHAWQEIARRESGDANFRYTFLTLDRVI